MLGARAAVAEGGHARPRPNPGPPGVGDSPRNVSFALLDGAAWTLDAARGKVAVILFVGPGKEQVPSLRKLAELAKAKERAGKVRCVGIFEGVTKETAEGLLEAGKPRLDVPLAVDPERALLARFAAEGSTRVLVLDRTGKITLSEGAFAPKTVAAKVDELLQADAAFLRKVETLPEKDMRTGDETYLAILERGLDVLPHLFTNLGQAKTAEGRFYLQLCAKQVLRRDFLARNPEYKYVAWVEKDHTAELLAWWKGLDKKALAEGEYLLPPIFNAVKGEGR